MIGGSQSFLQALRPLDKIACCDATVLVEGETGTGKELVARAVHYGSKRRDGPFIPVNCGALPDSLLENELFGHARGAYTDAHSQKPGVLELADGGTLFLDEVDALTPKAQVTILRFLQDRRFRPLGSHVERSVDARIVAASNRSLEALAESGDFRLDLLYRIRLLHIRLPALRHRPGDATLLARHFVGLASKRFGGDPLPLDESTLEWLEDYSWPGNVRELENLVYQGFLLVEGKTIVIPRPDAVGAQREESLPVTYRDAKARAVAAFERRFLTRALQRSQGNISAAARSIGTERRHLGRLLKKHGIEVPSTR